MQLLSFKKDLSPTEKPFFFQKICSHEMLDFFLTSLMKHCDTYIYKLYKFWFFNLEKNLCSRELFWFYSETIFLLHKK